MYTSTFGKRNPIGFVASSPFPRKNGRNCNFQPMEKALLVTFVAGQKLLASSETWQRIEKTGSTINGSPAKSSKPLHRHVPKTPKASPARQGKTSNNFPRPYGRRKHISILTPQPHSPHPQHPALRPRAHRRRDRRRRSRRRAVRPAAPPGCRASRSPAETPSSAPRSCP